MRLIVHLIPKASANKIEGWAQDVQDQRVLRVKVTAVPEDGKANLALIKLLSKTFHVSKSRISLVRGTTSRIKELDIEIREEELERIISAGS
ncbi:MAG: DUF167 domain-containing protein [Proteobacteria bacterium]|nr:DUF167 domain-containing protein [Pseudomonadota bacterium]